MTEVDKKISDYISYLEDVKQRSSHTARNYDLYLRRFSDWLRKNNIEKISNIDLNDINKFRSWLSQYKDKIRKRVLDEKTKNYHLVAIRGFLKYLSRKSEPCFDYKKIKLNITVEKNIACLEKNELEKLLDAPLKYENNILIRKRDKALLELIFSTGLKVSQIACLSIKQLNLARNTIEIQIRNTKQNILISNQASHCLKDYFRVHQDNNQYVFLRHDRAGSISGIKKQTNLTPRSIERIIIKYSKYIGLKRNATPQLIRHSFTKNSLLRGVEPKSMIKLLGNKSLMMMKRYLKFLK